MILELGGYNDPTFPDAKQADTVARDGVDVVFTWGDEKIPLPDNSVKGFFASHVLEHIPWWKVRDALAEAYRVVQPGGWIELHVPNVAKAVDLFRAGTMPVSRKHCRDQWEQMCAVMFWGDPDFEKGTLPHWHKSGYTPEVLDSLVAEAGFGGIERVPSRPPHIGRHAWHDIGVRGVKR